MNEEWNVEKWNNFNNTDQPAGEPAADDDYNLDDVMSVLTVEDMICPRCSSERIIANWLNPKIMCCVDCGIIFDYE